jgi:hypothetical protein
MLKLLEEAIVDTSMINISFAMTDRTVYYAKLSFHHIKMLKLSVCFAHLLLI